MDDKLKLLVFTDLHSEIIDNAEERVDSIINAAKSNNVDLIINIGDFGYHATTSKTLCEIENQPVNYNIFYNEKTEKYSLRSRRLLKKFEDIGIPVIHTLGNHDMDFNSKKTAIEDYGISNNYYYYDIENFRIIVLDTNYYLDENLNEVDYSFGNNFNQNNKAILSYEQIEWLKIALQTDKNVIICSHNVLLDDPRGIDNYQIVDKILNNTGKKILALSGHKHVDRLTINGNISFLEVNSASYHWMGEDNMVKTNYSDDYLREYPVLPYILKYPETLNAIIYIDGDNIEVKGKGSDLNLDPKDIYSIKKLKISAKIKDYKF